MPLGRVARRTLLRSLGMGSLALGMGLLVLFSTLLLACSPVALASSSAGSGALGPAEPGTLGPANLGVPLTAPAAPPLGETHQTSYSWKRCSYYDTLVRLDGAQGLWPLGEADEARSSSGPLVQEGGVGTSFNGTSSALTLPGLAPESATGAYSFELWARPTTIDASYRFLISQEETLSGKREGTGIWLSKAGLGFERWSEGVSASITYTPGLQIGVWSQVLATYDGSTMRLYVNGVMIGSKATTSPLSAPDALTAVGAGSGADSGFFSGDLADVAIYPSALARAHVNAHYTEATTPPCSTIAGAEGSTYTPTLSDLGRTLSATTTSTGASHSAGTTGQSEGPIQDGHGNVSLPSIEALNEGETVSGTVVVNAAVHGLPADRIEFDVDGQYRYAKPAEAPYQYTWYTKAESNGPHVLSVKLWGPGASTPVSTQLTLDVHNTTSYPTPLPLGEESVYAEMDEGEEATAQDLLGNVWPARGYPLPYLAWPLTWEEDPYHEAYWEFYFYGLRPEATLLYEWETTKNTAYLEKLIAILRSYVAYDATRPVNTVTFDNDHTSAYRTMELINFYVKLKIAGALPKDLEAGLARSLEKLGGFLAEADHFEADYNHGFNEGIALLLLADNFPHMPGASGWRLLALERLQAMLTNTIDANGVEVENSPFYQVYVLGLVYQIGQWAKHYEPTLAAPYSEAANKMLRFTADVTQPNGYLPMLGATATTYMPSQDPNVYGPMAAANPEFDFAFTRGAHGTPPPDGTVLFPVSGLFLMRSPLGPVSNLPNQTFITFNSGTYRTSHSDLDAMGITMYSNGAEVLPTSGLYTYTEEPGLEYFHGTRSHNTVVVDGKDQEEGSSVAGSYGSSEGSTWASGVSKLYPGVTHHRTVIILRQGLVLVDDELSSASTHEYSQTWHLSPTPRPASPGHCCRKRDRDGQRQAATHHHPGEPCQHELAEL